MSIISMISDFGLRDPYVGEMKAVIFSINPEASVIDISHEIRKFSIREGAFVLASATPYFPFGAIHLAVVDPGVGTERRPIIIKTSRSIFCGPDNGLLLLAAQREKIRKAFQINNPKYMLPRVSRTFHGRDVFAPAAAHLARGVPPSEFGPEINDYTIPRFAKPSIRENWCCGEIIYLDSFGNIVSNISASNLEKNCITEGRLLEVKLKNETISLKLCSAYGEVPPKMPLAIIGGSDFFEVSINQGNASNTFKVRTGDALCISLE